MGRSYCQLDDFERVTIQTQLQQGLSPAAIAAGLKRARSTVTRELARNGWKPDALASAQSRRWGNGGYVARRAGQRARENHRKPRTLRRLRPGTALWDQVCRRLRRRLSPEQIAGTLRRMPEPVRISRQTIYNTLYALPRGELRRDLRGWLRRRRIEGGRVDAARGARPFVHAMRLIDERPAEVDRRLIPGHWEGDLLKGAMNRSRVGTLVERTTLFVALVKLDDGRAETVARGFSTILNRFQSPMRLTLTYDQGREMAHHRWLEQQTGMQVYFAHPHSPWERGLNENTNGLLREYLPKGSDLGVHSQQELDRIAMELNARIRKSLGWKAPAELFLPKGDFHFQTFWSSIDKIEPVALGS